MSLFHKEERKKDPVLLIVKGSNEVDVMRRLLDEDLIIVTCMHMAMMGRRFSAIINTVSVLDYESTIEQLQFQQWITEYVPTKLNIEGSRAKALIHLNGTP
jgi:hypothetical protein